MLKTVFTSKSLELVSWNFKLVTKLSLIFADPGLVKQMQAWIAGDMLQAVAMTYYRFKGASLPDIVEILLTIHSPESLTDVF
jgi:hypothetical protein